MLAQIAATYVVGYCTEKVDDLQHYVGASLVDAAQRGTGSPPMYAALVATGCTLGAAQNACDGVGCGVLSSLRCGPT